jgi:hypothetical protein
MIRLEAPVMETFAPLQMLTALLRSNGVPATYGQVRGVVTLLVLAGVALLVRAIVLWRRRPRPHVLDFGDVPDHIHRR